MLVASFLSHWFGWPDGSVLTNLVASGLCAAFAIWRIVKSHRQLHKKLDRLHKHLGVEEE